jgi:hypothetical protein
MFTLSYCLCVSVHGALLEKSYKQQNFAGSALNIVMIHFTWNTKFAHNGDVVFICLLLLHMLKTTSCDLKIFHFILEITRE